MSSKLDQSLDDILSNQRKTAGNRRRSTRRSSGPAKPSPSGGVQKSTRPARGINNKSAPAKPARTVGESKIVVSNLPKDVSEAQIKDYFSQAVGQVKRVELSYGPGGVSRGIATVVFHYADGASKAFSELNGLLIDNRAVKVEVVVAKAELIPQPKTLGQRISQPKSQPKSAASDKRAGNAAKGASGQKGANNKNNNATNKPGNTRRAARSARPAKKTAEELDSEMADYFVSSAAGPNGTAAPATTASGAAAAAPAAATGDASMDDEIM